MLNLDFGTITTVAIQESQMGGTCWSRASKLVINRRETGPLEVDAVPAEIWAYRGQWPVSVARQEYISGFRYGPAPEIVTPEDQPVVLERVLGVVEESSKAEVKIVLNIRGEKKVYLFPARTLERTHLGSPKRGEKVTLEVLRRNGEIEGKLVRSGFTREPRIERTTMHPDLEYFLTQER